jgi:hypothetical protein
MTHTVPSPVPRRAPRGLKRPARNRNGQAELAARRPETLLLIRLLIEDPGVDGPALMGRLAGQLRLCADVPELADSLGCEPTRLDPVLVRAAARLLSDAARA